MAQHADAKLTDLPLTLADRAKARSLRLYGHSFDRVQAMG
jgi:hypothetical protein